MADSAMDVDQTAEYDPNDPTALANKIINEEYKIWKKNAQFLYDTFYARALDWPTLTAEWFPDVKSPPTENLDIHRLLIGTHTNGEQPNYLQIAEFSVPKSLAPDPAGYDDEKGEIGGFGGAKKDQAQIKFHITQRIYHEGEVNKARYMPQNPDIIATMCVNGKTAIFDRTKHPLQPRNDTFEPEIVLEGHDKEGFGLSFNRKKEGELATGSEDCTVKLWDIQQFSKTSKELSPTRTFTHHSAIVTDVEFHPFIPYLLGTVSDDLSLQIVDTRASASNSSARMCPNAHADAINAVAFNHGSEYILATGSADKSIGIWDLRNLKVKLHACEGHRDAVSQIKWSPFEKQVLASASYDRRITFWDLARCGEEQTPEDAEDGPPELLFQHGGHTNRISDFDFNKNEPWLMCSAAEDNLIHVWKPAASLVGKDTADVALEELEA